MFTNMPIICSKKHVSNVQKPRSSLYTAWFRMFFFPSSWIVLVPMLSWIICTLIIGIIIHRHHLNIIIGVSYILIIGIIITIIKIFTRHHYPLIHQPSTLRYHPGIIDQLPGLVMTNSSPWEISMALIEIDGLPNLIAWWIFPWLCNSHNQMVIPEAVGIQVP